MVLLWGGLFCFLLVVGYLDAFTDVIAFIVKLLFKCYYAVVLMCSVMELVLLVGLRLAIVILGFWFWLNYGLKICLLFLYMGLVFRLG